MKETTPNPHHQVPCSTLEIGKESAKSKRHTGSSWQGWCICVFLLSRHILSTLAPVELHAKLVEHIQKGPEYQWRAYIATVVRYHVRPQWPILGQGKESRNLRKAEKRWKSIGQIATMTMLMLTRQLLFCNAMHSVCFITTSRAACEKRKKSQSHSGISINQSKCYRTYHANARPFCA